MLYDRVAVASNDATFLLTPTSAKSHTGSKAFENSDKH